MLPVSQTFGLIDAKNTMKACVSAGLEFLEYAQRRERLGEYLFFTPFPVVHAISNRMSPGVVVEYQFEHF